MQAVRKGSIAQVEPLFDSPRKALHFALNHRAKMARPAMSKLVADGRMQKIELADGSKIIVMGGRSKPPRSEQLKGMDGVAQAGMVLYHLARLPEPQQLVLIAQSVPVALPCACRAPCCSGHRPNGPWVHAVLVLCDYLRDEAKLSVIPGKRGMSINPHMRRQLVEKFFVQSREINLAKLAAQCGVSEQTVTRARAPIIEYLEKNERAGWRAFDEHLGTAGIVGHIS